jgi:hypothetical protein
MTEEKNWGAEEWRAPKLARDDVLLYSECGRIVKKGTYGHCDTIGIDYRSHYFSIVKRHGSCWLLVHHGGGQEEFEIDYSARRVPQFFEPLDSTERYLLMHLLFSVHKDARRAAAQQTAEKYATAFRQGRLKKRKARNNDTVKVWIEPTKMEA